MTNATYLAFEPADAALAQDIARALESQGFETRMAEDAARRGEDAAAHAALIGRAHAVVAILSSGSAESAWMRREIMAALNNGRVLVPVIASAVARESWLSHVLDPARVIDLTGIPPEAGVGGVVAAVREAAGKGRTIAMLNIKGGVGKTVLAANLFAAAHLADRRNVIFIDLDPQHNLTQYFLPPAERHRVRQANQTIYSVLRGENGFAAGDVRRIPIPLNRAKGHGKPRFELVAGDERLFEFTLDSRSENDKLEAFTRFHGLIAALRPLADAIVIDANPCATFLTRLAVSAADHIVAPVRPEKYSLTGLNMLEHVVSEVRGRPLKPGEFSVLLNATGDRVRSRANSDADAATRAEISAAPFFGSALLAENIPYSGALKATPADRYAVNPINVTAMMRVTSREVKSALASAAASILRRAAQ